MICRNDMYHAKHEKDGPHQGALVAIVRFNSVNHIKCRMYIVRGLIHIYITLEQILNICTLCCMYTVY